MLIRALVITAAVLCADEIHIRVGPGPKTRKKYLLVACTSLLTYYFLGGRSMKTFDAFVFPDLSGSVLVHDRCQNYDAIAGVLHQLCCARILRDLGDAAQAHPDAIWPVQAADALRALIHAAGTARGQGLPAVPGETAAADLRLFPQRPQQALLLECLNDREADVLRFLTDLRIPPTSTRPNATCAPPRPSRRSPAGSAPRPRPPAGTPSAGTSPPPRKTARASSPPSATPSPETPGCHPSPTAHNPARKQSHSANSNNAGALT